MKKGKLYFQPSPFWLHKVLRPGIHFLCLVPFIQLLVNAFTRNLGTNPVELLTHTTGEWALRILLITLIISPLIKLTKNNWLILFRRPLGLYGFFYAFLHFLVYLVFDQGLSFAYLWEDIVKRPYITVGFTALILLIPLALTSTKQARRKLGKNWNHLHKLAYVIALLGIVHLVWLTRADFIESWIYGTVFLILMAFRMPWPKHGFKVTNTKIMERIR